MSGLLSRVMPREKSFFKMFQQQAENIKTIEHRGDTLTHDLMTRLNQTFITPFDREDIHALSSKMDDVLDLIDAAASRLVTYRVNTIRHGVVDLARILALATEELKAAVGVLEKHDSISAHCIEINRLENDADRMCRTLIAHLFEEEKDPVEIIKWKEIIETLETATDKCEDVANVLDTVILKST